MDTGGSVRYTGGNPHERDGGAVGTCTEHGHGCFAPPPAAASWKRPPERV
jgi:hypothetical protein